MPSPSRSARSAGAPRQDGYERHAASPIWGMTAQGELGRVRGYGCLRRIRYDTLLGLAAMTCTYDAARVHLERS